MSGQIVIVSGTSGAGKTVTCNAFARRADEMFMLFGADLLVGSLFPPQYTIFGPKKDDGFSGTSFGEAGWKAVRAMHEMIAAASRLGQNLIVDHLMFLDPPVLQDCIWRLIDLPVLFVNLTVAHDVIEGRLMSRHRVLPDALAEFVGPGGEQQMAASLNAIRDWFYKASYENDCFDLVFDTTALSTDEICERIEERLAQGPGTAFDELRERYPRPQ
jgi:chloramphenicol 3-O-phosphotransferase